MEAQKMVKYGFISFNGVKWSDGQIDAYNRLTKQINCYSQLNDRHCEQLLNTRHLYFCISSKLA